MKNAQFVIVLFLVSFLSDVVLNDLSKLKSGQQGKIIKSLRPYFETKSITRSGVYAGLTILSAFIPTALVFWYFYRRWIPSTVIELIVLLIIAFPIGYLYDYLIYKWKIFGTSLDDYYKEAGAGMWGAFSFEFALIITFTILNVIGC